MAHSLKFLKMIYEIWILALSFLAILILLNIGGIFVVKSDSMKPTIDVGDLVIIEKVQPKQITTGDIIMFQPNQLVGKDPFTHRVTEVKLTDDGKFLFKTKGDNNLNEDPYPVSYSQVLGRVLFIIPQVGKITFMLNNPITLPIILLIGAFLLTLNQKQQNSTERLKLIYVMPNGNMRKKFESYHSNMAMDLTQRVIRVSGVRRKKL